MFWRNINNIHNYNEKGFLCVVNLFNEARNTVSNSGKGSISFRSIDYRFSRVYLLRFSKGQLGPRDIDLNNNNIGRRDIRYTKSVLFHQNSYLFIKPLKKKVQCILFACTGSIKKRAQTFAKLITIQNYHDHIFF